MAIFHNRKLFQYSTPSSPCFQFCDPSCTNSDDCYYFSDDPPRIPANPLPLSAPVKTIYQFSPLAIVIIVVLASVFLLVSCSAFILKCFTSWFTRRNNPNPVHSDRSGPVLRESDNLFGENDDIHDQTVNHPIWLISTVGLQQNVINSIRVVKYKKEDGLIEGIDCSICLGEFEEEETLRVLPKCNHAFHIECIDPWLRSHTNCPLCRAGIDLSDPNPTRPGSDPSEPLGQVTRDVETGGIQIGDSSENRGNIDHIVNGVDDDGPLVSERRSVAVQLFRDSSSNIFRLTGSSSSSRVAPRVRPSSGSSFSPMIGPIKRSNSWSERVIGSTDNPKRKLRLSP